MHLGMESKYTKPKKALESQICGLIRKIMQLSKDLDRYWGWMQGKLENEGGVKDKGIGGINLKTEDFF